MLTKLSIITFFATLFALFTCCSMQKGVPPGAPRMASGRELDFPDSVQKPPSRWEGPVFDLSQDYPRAPPTAENYRWKEFDFKTQPREYLTAVLRYVYDGNIEVDWAVQKNPVRRWFHVPWMHEAEIKEKESKLCRDEKGREFIHGLTRERSTSLAELNFGKDEDKKKCRSAIQNWAVSVYNPPGGFVIRQFWEEMTIHQHDPTKFPQPEKFPKDFPDGTVVVKLLFTAATPKEVPYLEYSPEWRADINRNGTPAVMRLLQVDVAVRESRETEASGWVFGTFVYDKDAPPLYEDGKDITLRWRTLKPIGLMYGVEVAHDGKPSQTVLVDEAIKQTQHLGCEDRLNGPVDNLKSSCLSCHALAEVSGGDKPFVAIKYDKSLYNQCECLDNVKFWFKNLRPGEALSKEKGAVSLHYSLQLSDGIERYCQFNRENCPRDPDRLISTGGEKPCKIKIENECPEKQLPKDCTVPPTPLLATSSGVSLGSDISPDRSLFVPREVSRGGDLEELADAPQPKRTNPNSKKARRK
jgi:hypothetical protein